MSSQYVLITVVICALCTQVTRWLPFLVFGRKKELPRLVRYLGAVLPAAIMAVLVVYCLKDALTGSYHAAPEILAILFIVLLHKWKRNTLMSIGAGTALYMFLLQNYFR